MKAEKAAAVAGWLGVMGYWFFTDLFRIHEHERPAYFRGTARDLCLSQGIEFDEATT